MESLTAWANQLGYMVWWDIVEAYHYGSCSTRPRVYILGVRIFATNSGFSQLPKVLTDAQGIKTEERYTFPAWWHQIGLFMQDLQVEPLPFVSFFLPLHDERRHARRAQPEAGSSDKAAQKNKKDSELTWETDHCCKYQQVGLEWPPQFDPTFSTKVSHLCRRKAELVWYFEKTTEPDLLTEAFVDINQSINWCSLTVGKLGCLVSTSHVWCFGRKMNSDVSLAGDAKAGLDLAGEEALAIQGFRLGSQDRALLDRLTPQQQMDLAGNAFNGAAAVACFTALMCSAPWGQVFKAGHDGDMSAHGGRRGR